MSENQEIDPLRVMETEQICMPGTEGIEGMEGIVSFNKLGIGDFIKPHTWSRPRVIVASEGDATGPVYFLADPDHSKPRRVDIDQFMARNGWVRYPHLGTLWRAYKPSKETLPMVPGATGKVGTRAPFGGLL